MSFDTPVEEEELEAAIRIAAAGRPRRAGALRCVRLRTFGSRVDARHRRRHLQGAAASGARPAAGQTGKRCAMTESWATRETNRRAGAERAAGRAICGPPSPQAIEADRAGAVRAVAAAPRRSRWLPAVGMAAAVALVTLGVFIGRESCRRRRGRSSRHDRQAGRAGAAAGRAARRELPQAARCAAGSKWRPGSKTMPAGRAREGGGQPGHAAALDRRNRSGARTRSGQCAAARVVSEFLPGRNARADRGA